MSTRPTPKQFGRYQVIREIGQGAMGVLYEGRDPETGQTVAIKTARRDVMDATGMAEEMMERFMREAKTTGSLNHPNIIELHEVGQEEDVTWIAMEFLDGRDLKSMLSERLALRAEEIVDIGEPVCQALSAAHRAGVVHRDIKPANIMVLKDGTVKLMDFGIAHVADSTLTVEGALVGTPHYMSPEQFMGQPLDGRADLFCVGVLLYELSTGEKPFLGDTLSTVMHEVMRGRPLPPCDLNPNIPVSLSDVIMTAIMKKPQDRYPNAKSMAQALSEALKDEPDALTITPSTDESLVDPVSTYIPGQAIAPEDNVPEPDPTPRRDPDSQQGSLKPFLALSVVLLLLTGIAIAALTLKPTADSAALETGRAAPLLHVPIEAYYTNNGSVRMKFSEPGSTDEKSTWLKEYVASGEVVPLAGGTVAAIDSESNRTVADCTLDENGACGEGLTVPATTENVRFTVTGNVNDRRQRDEQVFKGREQWLGRKVFLLYD